MKLDCFVPTDQTKRPRFKTYIIHSSYEENLLTIISPIILKDLDSLKSSLQTATIKNNKSSVYLAENAKQGEIPQGSYHRKCNSLFTLKRDLLENISQGTGAKQISEFNLKSKEQSPRRKDPAGTRRT